MRLIDLSKYMQDETAAENYLIEKGILRAFTNCPYCDSYEVKATRRNLIKCYDCKKEWHKRRGSFLEGKKIRFSTFIALVKFYADEFSLNYISKEIGINKKTAIILTTKIRELVISSVYKDFNKNEYPSILYISNDKLHLEYKKNLDKNKSILQNYMRLDYKRYKEYGNIYSFLINSEWIGNNKSRLIMINNFLSFAKMKLISYRGIKYEYFFNFLLEMIIKFNMIDHSFYDIVLNNLHYSRMKKFPESE